MAKRLFNKKKIYEIRLENLTIRNQVLLMVKSNITKHYLNKCVIRGDFKDARLRYIQAARNIGPYRYIFEVLEHCDPLIAGDFILLYWDQATEITNSLAKPRVLYCDMPDI